MTGEMNTKTIEKGIKQILATGHGYGPEYKTTLKTTQSILQKINKQRKKTAFNYFQLAQCFIELEDTQLAMESLREALKVDPTHHDSLCLLIALFENTGMLQEASMATDDLLALQPDNIEANYMKAYFQFKLKDYIGAVQYATKAASGDEIHFDSLVLLGSCFNELIEYPHALKFLQVAYFSGNKSTDLFYQLGRAFYYSFQTHKAIDVYLKGLELDEHNYDLNIALYKAYLELGEQDKLRHYLAKAVWRNRGKPESHFYLGFLYGAMDQPEKAIRYYEKVLVKNPNDNTAKLNIAHLYQVQGDYDKAIPMYQAILREKSDAAQASINLGLILIATGKLEDGFRVFNNRFDNMKFKFNQLNWQGESLIGKKVLIRKEQGIGDQIESAWYFKWLNQIDVDATVQVDERLIPLLSRSFPKFKYVTFSDEYINNTQFDSYDFQVLQKSLGLVYFPKIEEAAKGDKFTEQGYLKADPKLLQHWTEKVNQLPNRPTIGVAWRSGFINRTRKNYYLSVKEVCDLFKDIDANVINLQYSFNQAELTYLREHLGDRFVHFDDIDLKDDQDALAALIKSVDMVFTAPTAVYDLCGAVGKRTLCYSYAHSEPAAQMYGAPSNPMFPDVEMIWSVGRGVVESLEQIKEKLITHINELK